MPLYQLIGRSSRDTNQTWESENDDWEAQYQAKTPFLFESPLLPADSYSSRVRRWLKRNRVSHSRSRLRRHAQCLHVHLCRRLLLFFHLLLVSFLTLIAVTAIFRPSYTHLPPHYEILKARASQSNAVGRVNTFNEKVFIAVSLYDQGGRLVEGSWGQSVLDLIDLLGHDNVFLSIYENDSGDGGTKALKIFKERLHCRHELVSEAHVPLEDFPVITLPDGAERLKRLTYLSELRNRALRPLDEESGVTYDKVLYLNDVSFYPLDAAQLLFSTNVGTDGKADYLTACSVDFVDYFKFYDTYATRDLEGYSMGVPFYPWFSSAGSAQSRSDVMNQKDAVRVKSCWGGMVAFDAKYLQSTRTSPVNVTREIESHTISPSSPATVSLPVRFRAEPEMYYDACECCLIQADILSVSQREDVDQDTGIYFNPFVRVAYSPVQLGWLGFIRRFERLFVIPQWIANTVAGMPHYNPYRTIQEGDDFEEEIWVADSTLQGNGSWQLTNRTARNGLYCGVRKLEVIIQTPRAGGKNWESLPVPDGGYLW